LGNEFRLHAVSRLPIACGPESGHVFAYPKLLRGPCDSPRTFEAQEATLRIPLGAIIG
jgi:hypothetical protein